jgi:hypothetical protein
MKSAKLLSVCLLVFMISSCASLTREETNTWLNLKTGESRINMTGIWDSGGLMTGGWGEGHFVQDGKRFSGSLGMYNVDGIVSGEDVYMVLSSGSKVYYTAQLKKSGENIFTGKAVQDAIIGRPESQNAVSYLISLKRMADR